MAEAWPHTAVALGAQLEMTKRHRNICIEELKQCRATNSELLAALEGLLGPERHGERDDGPSGTSPWLLDWDDVRRARAAIAKARGDTR